MVEMPKWWVFLIEGLIAILFGIVALAWPGATTYVLVILFGLFVLLDGLVAVAVAIYRAVNDQKFFGTLMLGLIGVIIGIITFARPGITTFALLFVIAVWAIFHGFARIIEMGDIPKEFKYRWLLAVIGALWIIIGILFLIFPFAGVFTIILVIAIYALIMGIVLIFASFALRSMMKEVPAA